MNPAALSPALARLQADFQRHLLGHASTFIHEVQPGGSIDAAARLHIYHHAYRARLVDALRDVHGHTARHLGGEDFDALACEYVEAHAPEHTNLRWYGASFPDWLAQRHAPHIGELALLDAALRKAFDGPDAPILALEALAAIAPDAWSRIGFALHPTCARLRLVHNTLALWQALDREEATPRCEPLPAPTQLLIWRRELQPHFRSLGPLECDALDGLLAGRSFAETCERLAQRFPDIDIAAEAGRLLRRWSDEGLLSEVREPACFSAPAT